MFDTGTRVIVTNSSFSGKTGPKRGSVGYVLDMRVGDHGTQFDSNQCWFASLHRVVFVRYGFGESQRNEAKFFINLTPFVSSHEASRDKFNTDKLIEAKLDGIEKFDSTGIKLYDKIKYFVTSKFGKNHVHTGIITPTSPSVDLLKSSAYDFQAWVECFMRDTTFYGILSEMLDNYDRLRKVMSGDNLVRLRKMVESKAMRNDQLEICEYDPKMKEEFVTTIRKILAIGYRPECRRVHQDNIKWLSKNGLYNSTRRQIIAMNMIFERLYSERTKEKFEIISKQNKGDKVVERKFDFMTRLIPQMVSHARALERVSD